MFQKKSKSTESISGDLHVILGTNKGGLALYSYSTAKVSCWICFYFIPTFLTTFNFIFRSKQPSPAMATRLRSPQSTMTAPTSSTQLVSMVKSSNGASKTANKRAPSTAVQNGQHRFASSKITELPLPPNQSKSITSKIHHWCKLALDIRQIFCS